MPLRRRLVRLLLAACVVVPLLVIGLYVWNRPGARSLDPRERILGMGLYRVASESMAPAFGTGDIVAIQAGDAAAASLRRGDVVVFAPPHRPDQAWLARVVGLPGETVQMRDRRVRIDGRALAEPYVDPRRDVASYGRDLAPQRVPAGHLFLLGDNRDNSEDSRFWGFATLAAVRGRVVEPSAQAASYAP